jgi:signal transduction histidine kinase
MMRMHFHEEPRLRSQPRFNVFPAGRMCSLRRALLLWLIPLFLVVGAASAAFSYWSYNRMVGEFLDDQMQQLGDSIALHDEFITPPGQTKDKVHQWGAYVTQVWSSDGRKLVVTSWPQLSAPLQEPGFHDIRADGERWRTYTTAAGAGGHTVQIVQSGVFRNHLAIERAGAAIAPVLILLPLAFLVLWMLSGAMSRAVQDIGQQAAMQDVHNLTDISLERVPAELKPLVTSFNGLLSRLRDSIATKRRFVQDAAHELRTPLTAITLQLENVRCDMPEGACAQSFAQLEAGVKRAQHLIDQLLKMTRQDTPQEASVPVDLHAQLHQSISALIALADQRNIDLGLVDTPQPGSVPLVQCSPNDLRSVLDNLIENALRYTPEGGVVDVRLMSEGGKPVIEVIDSGPGIPPEMLSRVFDRFFRVPGSQARGSGLGLAIAQAAATRCGMRVLLRNRDDGRTGLIARVEAV